MRGSERLKVALSPGAFYSREKLVILKQSYNEQAFGFEFTPTVWLPANKEQGEA
jgi:hypothetical protein